MSHTVRKHARLAPSAAHRWMNCPGSVRACEQFPNESSVFADEGTAAHQLAEHCLQNGVDAVTFAGEKIVVNGRDFEVDEEMVDGVQMYLDYVRELFDRCDFYFIEQRVDLTHVHPEIYGTGDAGGYQDVIRRAHIVDFKYGRGIAVDPERNEQLLCYASGVVKKLMAEGHEIVDVTLHVVQPRAPHRNGPIRTWTVSLDWLKRFEDRLKKAAQATEARSPKLVAGEHCKFCPAAASCKERKRKSLDDMGIEFGIDGAMDAPIVEKLTQDDLGTLLSEITQIEDWCRRVRDFAHQEAGHGRVPSGWKLVAKRAVRKWKDENAAAATLRSLFDLLDDELYTKKMISPAGADKLVGAAGKKQLAGLYTKESSGTVLATEDDPREAVRADPSVEFGEN